jgi:trans-2,3-dihydro-3-hydroxyanthranilate isomerase
MRLRPYYLLDVFTDRPLAGNALAVVMDADGLTDETMQAFARETRLQETTFVQRSADAAADYRNRIFTIAEELPFAGHPSLGTAVAVAVRRGLDDASFVQETRAGLQPVDVSAGTSGWHASVKQSPAVFDTELDPEPVLAALGLPPDVAVADLPPQLVSTGLPTIVCPVRDEAAVAAVSAHRGLIAALPRPLGSFNLYVAAIDRDGCSARTRSFPSEPEEAEDPATGSAAGALLAYLNERLGLERVEISQGTELGRPAAISAVVEDGRMRVGGSVVLVATGTVRLPA